MILSALFQSACKGLRSLFPQRGKAPDTTPQRDIRLSAYLGRWYEQARYECFFERGMDEVYADYARAEEGGLRITNGGTTASGKHKRAQGHALIPDAAEPGRLSVSFVPPYKWFRAPYHILYVDEDYRMALVSGAGRGYLWLLTRKRKADEITMRRLLDEAQKRGFDISVLRLTRQQPAGESAQNRKSAPNET